MWPKKFQVSDKKLLKYTYRFYVQKRDFSDLHAIVEISSLTGRTGAWAFRMVELRSVVDCRQRNTAVMEEEDKKR